MCPCGSERPCADCCGAYIAGTALPSTAEQLMRSRYTAYTRQDSDYLLRTWSGQTRPQTPDLRQDGAVRWLGLKIVVTEGGGKHDAGGIVEFVARYKLNGKAVRLHERSRFERVDGRWLYVDGIIK